MWECSLGSLTVLSPITTLLQSLLPSQTINPGTLEISVVLNSEPKSNWHVTLKIS